MPVAGIVTLFVAPAVVTIAPELLHDVGVFRATASWNVKPVDPSVAHEMIAFPPEY